jgi:hypothetical protein
MRTTGAKARTAAKSTARVPARRPKPAASKKAAPPVAAAGPTRVAEQPADASWAVGPYGDIVTSKEFTAFTRTRVS